ncbi:primosomal replication protein [Pasteurellaceae bacterium TAE3-ERU1]|nr:primosomal replication protein [Pasteurellaceae bacterium TAE3-ERU1]
MKTQLENLARAIAHFDAHKAKTLPAFFSPVLFPADPHTVAEAQAQMAQTLTALRHATSAQAAEFLAEQFTGQYRALAAAVQPAPMATSPQAHSTPRAQAASLPPRERLDLYYTYLARLKAKLEAQQIAKANGQSAVRDEHIAHTQARITRCQAAIEQLEEYLAFVKRREDGKSAV